MIDANKVIIALDVHSGPAALQAVQQMEPVVRFVKVGMELFYTAGPDLVLQLKHRGIRVFLDLKIHDIPNTAIGAIASLSRLGVDMMNVHCSGGLVMMQQARQALTGAAKLVGVTQLTSTDQHMLNTELGIPGTVEDAVMRYARLGKQAELHGVVCSPLEVTRIKQELGSHFLCVTPGVRPAGSATNDQRRVMTPRQALDAGADYLVVGRPVMAAADRRQALEQLLHA